ncbi:60S ribosomal protein L13 [Protomyces lactucae-debilis]|uniref:60S ribosomal protein L13 n=1 Tax=Protomyces lactucae-debilis TaxID=2754530 RepID=A0A1Y2FCC9_PROLT|nr:60S ribosomal protein L13 [Protomyces lactucae-debilis]ORY81561.1 60S ribosomal protein L13 [Protomyces lactucae-debilis]
MAIKHNNILAHNHFRKEWQSRVTTWFDQPGRKLRRRRARVAKAARVAPRPTDSLRPVVHCPTAKYNMKVRAGRGFSLQELKAAGIPRKFAKTVGICVDHRRQNKSQESLDANVERLKAYQAQLILFPRKHGKGKKGDADAATIAEAKQVANTANFPISQPKLDLEPRAITSEEKEGSRYHDLRMARSNARLAGKREAAAKKAQEEADAKAKAK